MIVSLMPLTSRISLVDVVAYSEHVVLNNLHFQYHSSVNRVMSFPNYSMLFRLALYLKFREIMHYKQGF